MPARSLPLMVSAPAYARILIRLGSSDEMVGAGRAVDHGGRDGRDRESEQHETRESCDLSLAPWHMAFLCSIEQMDLGTPSAASATGATAVCR